MQTDPSSYFRKLNPKSGVVVVDGHGARIRIERGHLVITDGIGPAARERRFPRAGHGLKRLIVLGQTGYVSLEAIRWMSDVGIAFIHVDRSGRVLATSAILGLDQPLLRRAQALAGRSSIGLDIARQLIALKVDGQTALLDRPPDAERTRV